MPMFHRLLLPAAALTLGAVALPLQAQQPSPGGMPPPPPSGGGMGAPGSAPAQPSPDEVVVTVEGTEITHGQLMGQMQQTMMQLSQRMPPEQLQQMAGRIYQDTQNSAIAEVLLAKEARDRDIEVDDEKVEAQVEQARKSLPEDMSLEDALAQQSMTMDEWKETMRDQMRIEKLVEDIVADVEEASDEEVTSFYEENKEQFRTPGNVTASHILLGFEEEDTDEQKADKKAKLESIKQELDEGADFAEMAKEHSTGPSGPRGGELGSFSQGQMVPPFEKAAFAMEPGDISDVVETQFGYHLIQVTDKQEEGIQALEDVRPQLTNYLTNQKKQEKLMAHIEKLREDADITIHNQGNGTP